MKFEAAKPWRWLQDRVARALDIQAQDRSEKVSGLLKRSRSANAAYWSQLVLVMAIAALGLTLNSTGVVIGAMLIAPLMGPIVELGIVVLGAAAITVVLPFHDLTGLAVGSPLLFLRSLARVTKSVALIFSRRGPENENVRGPVARGEGRTSSWRVGRFRLEGEVRMSSAFVWFHNGSDKPADAVAFYEKLLGWKGSDGPPGMKMLTQEGGPFAAVMSRKADVSGWVPYVQVDDVSAATKKAAKLGAEVLEDQTRGPAGIYSVVRDPGGALLALWQKG